MGHRLCGDFRANWLLALFHHDGHARDVSCAAVGSIYPQAQEINSRAKLRRPDASGGAVQHREGLMAQLAHRGLTRYLGRLAIRKELRAL